MHILSIFVQNENENNEQDYIWGPNKLNVKAFQRISHVNWENLKIFNDTRGSIIIIVK